MPRLLPGDTAPATQLEPKPTPAPSTDFALSRTLAERIKLFNYETIQNRPYLVGSLVASSTLPEYVIRGVATNIDQYIRWVDARDAVAGIPGYLTNIRERMAQQEEVLSAPTPQQQRAIQQRRNGLLLLERAREMTPQEQSLLLSVMNLPHTPEQQAMALASLFTPERLERWLGESLDASSERTTELLTHAFEEIRAAAESAGSKFAPFTSGQPGQLPMDPFNTVVPNLPRIVENPDGSFSMEQPKTGLERAATATTGMLESAFGPVMLAGEAAGAVLGTAARAVPGPVGAATGLAADVVGGSIRGGFTQLQAAGDVVLRNGLPLIGINPGDPEYEEAYEAGQFIFGALVLHTAGKAAFGIKTARTRPDIETQARLGLSGSPLDYLRHPVSRVVFDLFSHPVDRWLETRPGKKLMADFARTKALAEREGKPFSGVLEERYGAKVPLGLARALDEVSVAEMPRVFADYWRSPGGTARVKQLTERLDEVTAQLRGEALPPAPQAALTLRAERLQLQEQIRRASEKVPLFVYPKRNIIRSALREPVTRVERFLSFLLNPTGKTPALSKLADELPSYPTLFSPDDINRPANWREQNAHTASTWLRRAKVPQREITRIVGELSKLESGEAFFEWVKDVGSAINAALPKGTPPDVRYALTHPWDPASRTSEMRSRSVMTNEQGFDEYVLHTDNGAPLPSIDTEFARSLTLPNVDYAIEATSYVRRLANEARKTGIGKVAAGLLYDFPIMAMQAMTAVLKPLVLLPRAILLAMPARIQGEQFFRGTIHEGHVVFNLPGGGTLKLNAAEAARLRRNMPKPEAGDLGLVASEFLESQPGRPVPVTQSMAPYVDGGLTPPRRVWVGLEDTLGQMHSSRLMREFARRGYDVDATVTWLQTSEWGKRFVSESLSRTLAESTLRDLPLDVALRTLMERRKQQVLQITGGDPELLSMLGNGRLRQATVPRDIVTRTGEPIVERYATVREDIASVEGAMRQLQKGDPQLRALAETRRAYWEEAKRLEREAREQNVNLSRAAGDTAVRLDKPGRVATELARRYEGGLYELPGHVAVTERLLRSEDLTSGMRFQRNAISRALYRPTGVVLNKTDITRKSLYYDVLSRDYRALRNRGWSTADARARAGLHAAEVTRDVMYDLAGRTSLQRSLKDLFWFLPAWQEVLYTWFVKLPSQYYWPAGAVILGGKGLLMLDLLREMDVIKTDERGEEIIAVPWIGDGLEAAANKLGFPVKVPPITFARLEGFNTVTSGGGLPGLTTGTSFLLGKASLKYGGIYKDFADLLLPFGPEVSSYTSPINYFFETFFGGPPPGELFSPGYQKDAYDRTFDAGLQFAYSDLYHQGIRPPHVEDYKTEAEWVDASEAYLERWLAEGQEYTRGMYLVKLFGSVTFPASLHTTSEEKQQWERFWQSDIAPLFGESGLSEKQRDLIQSYVDNHPSSLAFATFPTVYGEATHDLPFMESDEDAFYDRYYTGEARSATPEEYVQKVAAAESLRHYARQLEGCLSGVGTTASEQLFNGYSRAECIDNFKVDFDRYLVLNPEIDAAMRRNRQLWADKYGVPLQTFEQIRLADDLTDLRIIARDLVNEVGARSQELRTAIRIFGQERAEAGGFQPPSSELERDRLWYMENVVSPYYDSVQPLYDQAEQLNASGQYAGTVYDKIRRINESYVDNPLLQRDGQTYPTPEAFSYGNLSEAEQQVAINKWATRPPSWLTTFQREKVGYSGLLFPKADEMLKRVTDQDDAFYAYVEKEEVSSSSKYYDALVEWNTRRKAAIAREYGPEGTRLLEVEEAAPYQRLDQLLYEGRTPKGRAPFDATDYLTENYGKKAATWWRWSVEMADYVTSYLKGEGLSPRGYSAAAVYYKAWFYQALEKGRNKIPELGNLLRDLSYAFPLDDIDHREGALLYNALYFNDFSLEHVPDELTEVAA